MLAFAAPAALIALTALAVPIALHLWSRLTGRPLRVGSVAWFAAAPPPVSRRPQIEDPWLLVLRCAVLAALALALAQPFWRSGPEPTDSVWALISADVAHDPASQPLIDSLRTSGAEIHELGPGPIWSLLRQVDYEAPAGTRLVVVAPSAVEGERPILRNAVSWMVRSARRDTRAEPLAPGGRSVVVYSDAAHRDDARYVSAAIRAAAQTTSRPAIVTQRDASAPSADADWIVWLADRDIPDCVLESVRQGATLLAADPAGHGTQSFALHREGLGRRYTFGGRFHPGDGNFVLTPAFPESISVLWAGEPQPDAPVALSQLLPVRDATRPRPAPARRDLYLLFWLTAVGLFVTERVVAARARQTAA